jgi:hypothetical protein
LEEETVRRCIINLFLLSAVFTLSPAQALPLPELTTRGARHSLLVDGQPFLMLGAQVDNITFTPQEMGKVLPGFRQHHANTVEFPVPWKLIEPQPGRFEFGAVDQIIRDIRGQGLRAIVLWFGTWKGDESQFLPDWIRDGHVRYPLAVDAHGHATKSLSPHGGATLRADRRAFSALMQHLRIVDDADHTVILVQVENEPGIVGSARDHSAAANRLFDAPVPRAFAKALHLKPGSWTQAFGAGVDEEAFTSYYLARYIDSVAAAGKQAYPLPMLVNAWQGGAGTGDRFYDFDRPGETYPSGGGQSHTLDWWKIAAPAIDLIAPDIYNRSLSINRTIMNRYARHDNPLLLVEAGRGLDFARYCFMAIGEYGAMGCAEFGAGIKLFGGGDNVQWGPGFVDMAANYGMLSNAAPAIAQLLGTRRLKSAIESENIAGRQLSFDRWDVLAIFPPAQSKRPVWMDLDGTPAPPSGRVLIAQLATDEFLVFGFDAVVDFRPPAASGRDTGSFTLVERGSYIDGVWSADATLPGATQARGAVVLPASGAMYRVKLASN